MPETAKRFILSLGIMEEAEIASPNQTEKGTIKNAEEAVSGLISNIIFFFCSNGRKKWSKS